jgi:hypothetical protein
LEQTAFQEQVAVALQYIYFEAINHYIRDKRVDEMGELAEVALVSAAVDAIQAGNWYRMHHILKQTPVQNLSVAFRGLIKLRIEELRPEREAARDVHGLYDLLGRSVDKSSDQRTIEALCRVAVANRDKELRNQLLTHYDHYVTRELRTMFPSRYTS